jgi:hypothetical protein
VTEPTITPEELRQRIATNPTEIQERSYLTQQAIAMNMADEIPDEWFTEVYATAEADSDAYVSHSWTFDTISHGEKSGFVGYMSDGSIVVSVSQDLATEDLRTVLTRSLIVTVNYSSAMQIAQHLEWARGAEDMDVFGDRGEDETLLMMGWKEEPASGVFVGWHVTYQYTGENEDPVSTVVVHAGDTRRFEMDRYDTQLLEKIMATASQIAEEDVENG